MNVSAWCIKNPIPSVMLFMMLTLAGLLGFQQMKIQQFPDIDLPTINITASLPGTAPAQMETEVARKLENPSAACAPTCLPNCVTPSSPSSTSPARPS